MRVFIIFYFYFLHSCFMHGYEQDVIVDLENVAVRKGSEVKLFKAKDL